MLQKISHFYINKYLVSPFSRKKYFISYDFKHKAIWYRNYKVATRSIDKKLKENASRWEYIYSSKVGYWAFRYKNYFKFAFVRNPIDRFLSAWKNKVIDQNYFKFSDSLHQEMKDINRFIAWVEEMDINNCDEHLMAQSALIDFNNVDFIGRFENFNSDFKYVLQKLNIENDHIEHINKSSNKKIDLPKEVQAKIAWLYEKDIRAFYPQLNYLLQLESNN